jgi:hypothetical protein
MKWSSETGANWVVISQLLEKASSSKRPRNDMVFCTEAQRLASESCSALACAQALNIKVKLLY